MARNRDLSKLLSTSNGKIAGTNLDVSFENITDTGTEGTKVAAGTTAQRGSTSGQFRFNSTTGKFEGRNASDFISIEVSPSVASVNNANPTETEIANGFNLVITGSNFSAGDSVQFIGNDNTTFTSTSVTIDSSSQITAAIPTSIDAAKEPFKVKVLNTGGLSGELANAFNINQNPVWTKASGTIGGGFQGETINVSTGATDPEGVAVSFSEVTSVLAGVGLTLNTSTGAITGTLPSVGSGTTYTFTLRATAGSQTSDRQYSIYNAGAGTQTIHVANTTLNVAFPRPIKAYVIGGGGGGAGELNQGSCGSAGGGGGGMAYKSFANVPTGSYTIVVGAAGLGGYHTGNSDEHGTAGGTSSFSGTGITTLQATGGAGGTDSDNAGSTDGVGGAGGIGTGGDINGTGGAGGRGTANATSPTFRNGGDGANGTNGAAGGGGGGTDSSSNGTYRGGHGGNGDTNYFTGGGGGGGCDGDGQNVSSSQTGNGGSGYSSGGKGGGQSTGAAAGGDTSSTSSGGATNALTGSRTNNGGGGGAFGGGGGGTGSADGGQVSGGCGGRGAVIITM